MNFCVAQRSQEGGVVRAKPVLAHKTHADDARPSYAPPPPPPQRQHSGEPNKGISFLFGGCAARPAATTPPRYARRRLSDLPGYSMQSPTDVDRSL